ncbi:hypothetical protein F0562_016658 [Nyssa sinensis]|uniref:Uncharacterized protein n=1 Tax=Nyssa sinensis TaxID=561372 RepID=A0A5J4ZCK3_9ASTE|nr:hypothetical protein F0562_016658 [Nyssa sinensis]
MTTIRMGGGPRTFPGGVSKWQWKRMQAKKAKQLLKARLTRERQIYEMRKRAELRAAVSELERPWEVVERAPTLFSVSADEQLKVLADRFQQPGGFDLWSEKDGPQLFDTVDGVPSARFFPKGVVHSIKPYGKIKSDLDGIDELSLPGSVSEPENGTQRDGYKISRGLNSGSYSDGDVEPKNSMELPRGRSGKGSNGVSQYASAVILSLFQLHETSDDLGDGQAMLGSQECVTVGIQGCLLFTKASS